MSFPRYPKYKDSGVEWLGEVPEHWGVKPIRRVISVPLSNGIFKKKEEFGEGVLLVNVFDIYRPDFKVDFGALDRVNCDPSETLSYEVLSGDLFFVRSSLKQEGIAVVAMAGSCAEPVVFECHLIRARPNRQVLDGRFGSYVLNSVVYRATMGAKAKITTMTTIDQEAILSTLLPIPSVAEQTHIAAFLDRETAKIDGLVGEQRRLMELLKEKRQAVISHAVTQGLNPHAPMKPSGIEWLGDVPAHWECACLTRIASRVVVGIAEAATHAYADEGVPILRSTNIRAGKIIGDILFLNPAFAGDRGSKQINTGDLVTVRTGNAGVTVVIPPELDGCQCFTMLITTLNEDSIAEYYCYWMNSISAQCYFSLEGWGTAQVNISVPILKALPIPLPPTSEQKEIVTYLDREFAKLDTLTAEAQRAIDLLQERRTALISAAVTGQIDVRDAVAA